MINGTATLAHGCNSFRTDFEINRSYLPQGYFGWLYRNLPEWRPQVDALAELKSLAEAMKSDNRNEGLLQAGYTYFAQLIDHDLTFDPSSLSQQIDDPELLHHYRTPAFDLDCIYGRGPRVDALYYSEAEPERMLLQVLSSGELDLPRFQGRAIIADIRNDDFLILSQLHVGFINFHNSIVDVLLCQPEIQALPRGRRRSELIFHTARKLVRWHYQWVVLYDFLPKILHPKVWSRLRNKVLKKLKTPDQAPLVHYRPEVSPYLPIEFTTAAFRFAHSLPRVSYELNPHLARGLRDTHSNFRTATRNSEIVRELDAPRSGDVARLGFICDQLRNGRLPVFTSTKDLLIGDRRIRMLGSVHPDLRGRRELPENWHVDWDSFLDVPGKKAQRAMAIEPWVSSPLFEIPIGASGQSLALLDLQKGLIQHLPSGQTLARRMGLAPQDILPEKAFPSQVELHLRRETPLFYYILAEASHQREGHSLGILGSEIVGEVLVGLMLADSTAFVNEVVNWKPNFEENYTLRDLMSCRFNSAALDGLYLGL